MINNTHPINIQIYKNPTGTYKSTSIHTYIICVQMYIIIIIIIIIITRCMCQKRNIYLRLDDIWGEMCKK